MTEGEVVMEAKEPPLEDPKPKRRRIDWARVVAEAATRFPDQWALAARNVPISSAYYLDKKHWVETRSVGVDYKNGTIAELYIKWVTDQSEHSRKSEKALKNIEAEEKGREIMRLIKEKKRAKREAEEGGES